MSYRASFRASDLVVEAAKKGKEKLPPGELTFGSTYTDHMLEVDWDEASGWGQPKISQFSDLKVSPASSCLHYGIQCFEGMKCYLSDGVASGTGGRLRLFRPELNMKRLNDSMQRLAMPGFDGGEMIELIKELVRIDKSWVPEGDGYSLYLRPTAIGTHPYLGVDVSKAVKLFVICSPVGPYYPQGFKPVSLYADSENKRAWPGGTGSYKVGGNYGPTILPAKDAMAKGYNQVLWMFGDDDQVTECGAMNLFFVISEGGEKVLQTAPLGRGDILPGVTRRSVLDLAEGWDGVKVRETFPKMKDIQKAKEEGRLLEAFGTGTAAVVSPISRIYYRGQVREKKKKKKKKKKRKKKKKPERLNVGRGKPPNVLVFFPRRLNILSCAAHTKKVNKCTK